MLEKRRDSIFTAPPSQVSLLRHEETEMDAGPAETLHVTVFFDIFNHSDPSVT